MKAGNHIRQLRRRLFLTQEVLAFHCRVATRTVAAWERGETHPTTRHQKRLAKALGVNVHDLRLEHGVR